MLKKVLNAACWIWFSMYGILYACIILNEGLPDTIKYYQCDEVASFITGIACIVLVGTHFVIPFVQKMEYEVRKKIREHKHKMEFKKYAELSVK